MYIFTEIIILIASTLIYGQINEYEDIEETDTEARTLPADLQIMMYVNKTDEELQYEDCMRSYTLCRTFDKHRDYIGVCAVDKRTGIKKTFGSFCEMVYENCKIMMGAWGFFHDGRCETEFGPS
uniref:Kazal-like domain-containing protein n=1 Tax=Heliothis virescens TaxID=7102 RepID=A0A2A4J7N5_HELVI